MLEESDDYDGLHSFADVKEMLDKVCTHKDLCALNDAVEERFMRDRNQLTMKDADWHEWTLCLKRKADQLQHQEDAKVHIITFLQ